MNSSNVTTQWQRLQLHLGRWCGTFARLDASGTCLSETPSVVTLSPTSPDAALGAIAAPPAIDQTVAFQDATGDWQTTSAMTYRSLHRGILFLANGAYSQGSLQASPIAQFGAEFGFVAGDRRLRVVLQYDPTPEGQPLTQITLIREHRNLPAPDAQPPLTVAQLVGIWQGAAQSIYPDWYEPAAMTTQLALAQQGDRLQQTLTFPGYERQSTARIDPPRLRFEATSQPDQPPRQVLLLPAGASITAPLTLPRHHSFFLEVGWLVSPTERQRLMRHYDAQGAWSHLTLVQEQKQ